MNQLIKIKLKSLKLLSPSPLLFLCVTIGFCARLSTVGETAKLFFIPVPEEFWPPPGHSGWHEPCGQRPSGCLWQPPWRGIPLQAWPGRK